MTPLPRPAGAPARLPRFPCPSLEGVAAVLVVLFVLGTSLGLYLWVASYRPVAHPVPTVAPIAGARP